MSLQTHDSLPPPYSHPHNTYQSSIDDKSQMPQQALQVHGMNQHNSPQPYTGVNGNYQFS